MVARARRESSLPGARPLYSGDQVRAQRSQGSTADSDASAAALPVVIATALPDNTTTTRVPNAAPIEKRWGPLCHDRVHRHHLADDLTALRQTVADVLARLRDIGRPPLADDFG